MKTKEELKEEINKGVDYSNGNRVWKAVGDLEDISYKKGKQEEQERILKIIDNDFKNEWTSYYNISGGKIGVLEQLRYNLVRIKSKIKGEKQK